MKLLSLFLIIACSLMLVACDNKSQMLIYDQSVDGITIGSTEYDVSQLTPDIHYDSDEAADCVQRTIEDKGLRVLSEDGIVNRIYIFNPAYVTPTGIHVGSSETETIMAYSDLLKIEPHKYVDDGHYLSLIDKAGKGFLFETDGSKITSISIGRLPALEYVEGCL